MLLTFVSPEVYVLVAIIAVFTFWPIKWICAKAFRQKHIVLITSLLVSIAIAPILYAVLIFGVLALSFHYPSETFSRERWQATGWRKENGDNVPPERYLYSQDLISRELLIGKTKDEVVEMLGEADAGGEDLRYNLGFVPGHGIDPDFLVVYFENGVVTRAEQHRT